MASVSHPRSSEDHRSLVLWFGRAPAPRQLVAHCLQHSLEVKNATGGDVERMCPLARAALFEFPAPESGFETWGMKAIAFCLDHGVQVALVLVLSGGSDLPVMPPQEDLDRYYAAVKALPGRDDRIKALYDNWHRIGLWLHDCPTLPSVNLTTMLEGDLPEDPSARVLLQRAFHDFSALRLIAPPRGKSGAGVWQAEPVGSDRERRALPFFAKIDKRERLTAERSNALIIANGVSKQFHAPLDQGRCVDGHTLALAVYDVVANAIPLRTALPANARGLIVALFEHALGPLRRASSDESLPLVTEFSPGRVKVLRWSDELDESAARARETDAALPLPSELRARAEGFPKMTVRVGTVHGDLHVGNMFAARSEVILIDFGSVTARAPLVGDPACLEVSLTFASAAASTVLPAAVDSDWLREAYRYPLAHTSVAPLSGERAWLAEAVQEIRLRAVSTPREDAAYGFAVACNLLRYASYADNGTLDERALAYELACDLLANVEKEQPSRGK